MVVLVGDAGSWWWWCAIDYIHPATFDPKGSWQLMWFFVYMTELPPPTSSLPQSHAATCCQSGAGAPFPYISISPIPLPKSGAGTAMINPQHKVLLHAAMAIERKCHHKPLRY